ncbi:hypothetical protein halTADL_1320 [Halohasta litchfieldiae]|nr:hypothetical protein [Halohasta litchfieldiae]ATW88097.1 hypothetical protein halTADL_1320 [Halohasta litchfieldiae]
MAISETVQRLSVLLVAAAATAVLLTESVMVYRSLAGRPLLSQFGFDVHYLVMNSVLIAAAGLLGVAAYQSKNILLFIGSCGIGSWTLAHIYWTLYVYLAGQPITYPSVAELGFQGFYIVLIPAVVSLQQRSGADRPVWLVGTVLLLVGAVIGTNMMYGTGVSLFVYTTVSATLVGTVLLFGLALVLYTRYRLFGAGLCLFAAADGIYIVLAISSPVLSVPYVDPVSVPHKASSASCFCGLSSVSKRLY